MSIKDNPSPSSEQPTHLQTLLQPGANGLRAATGGVQTN